MLEMLQIHGKCFHVLTIKITKLKSKNQFISQFCQQRHDIVDKVNNKLASTIKILSIFTIARLFSEANKKIRKENV